MDMATIRFSTKSNGGLATLYCRFSAGRGIGGERNTGLIVGNKWDYKLQKAVGDDLLDARILHLKAHLIERFNVDYPNGITVDGAWLSKAISSFLNRPDGEKSNSKHLIYLADFADYWINELSANWTDSDGEPMDKSTRTHYAKVSELISGYQKVTLRHIDQEWMLGFARHLRESEGYSFKTVSRMVARAKFFCARAEGEGIEVSKGFRKRVAVKKETEQHTYVYLDTDEISELFRLDLSHDDELDNIRDMYVIS